MALLVSVAAAQAAGAAQRGIVQRDITADEAPAVEQILRCRNIAEAEKRLACFDNMSAELSASIDRKDVVVVDRAQVRAAKRSLFGFALPDLGIFRSTDKSGHDDEDQKITATVQSAHQGNEGWVITLDNGATWSQTDGTMIARAPKSGDSVTIMRAAFGSYILKVGKQPGVKARREN